MIGGISGEARTLNERPEPDDLVWDMRWRGNDIIRERVERYRIDCDLKYGYADVR